MQAHTRTHSCTLWPGMDGHGVLRCHGSRHGLRGTLKGDEKPVPRRVNLVTIPRLAHLTEQSSVLWQYLSVLVAQVLEEVGGVLDVAEQEGDGATRCLRHTRCPPLFATFPARAARWSADRRRLL